MSDEEFSSSLEDNVVETSVIDTKMESVVESVEGKKKRSKNLRKKAEEYNDGSSRKSYASDKVKIDKGRPLDNAIVDYFIDIGEQVKELHKMDPDMREAFINNVHSEIAGREYRLATRNRLSEVVDDVLEHSTSSQVKSFFRACKGKYYNMMVHHCGSHVMETVLAKVSKILMDEHVQHVIIPWNIIEDDEAETEEEEEEDHEDEDADNEDNTSDNEEKKESSKSKKGYTKKQIKKNKKQLNIPSENMSTQQLVFDMCEELAPHWMDMFTNSQGSYCIRSIFQILSGHQISMKKDKNDEEHNVIATDLVEQSRSHIKMLRYCLRDIVDVVNEADEDALVLLCTNNSGSPALAALVKAIAERQRKASHRQTLYALISKLLLWKPTSANISHESKMASKDVDLDNETITTTEEHLDQWKLGNGSIQHVNSIVASPQGSRLMESILLYSGENVVVNFFYKHCIGKIQEYANDPIMNHVLQKLIVSIKSEALYLSIIEQLTDTFPQMFRTRKVGIVMNTVEGAVTKSYAVQKKIVGILESIFGKKIGDKDFFLRLCQCNIDRTPTSVRPVNYLGCRIIVALLGFNQEFSVLLSDGIIALKSEHIIDLLSDASGTRILQALLVSELDAKLKRKLIRRVEGNFAECIVATSSAGFAIEKMYHVGNTECREMILKDLLAKERKVMGSKGGAQICYKLRMAEYKKSYKIWNPDEVAGKKETIQLFEDVLNPRKRKADTEETGASKKIKN